MGSAGSGGCLVGGNLFEKGGTVGHTTDITNTQSNQINQHLSHHLSQPIYLGT